MCQLRRAGEGSKLERESARTSSRSRQRAQCASSVGSLVSVTSISFVARVVRLLCLRCGGGRGGCGGRGGEGRRRDVMRASGGDGAAAAVLEARAGEGAGEAEVESAGKRWSMKWQRARSDAISSPARREVSRARTNRREGTSTPFLSWIGGSTRCKVHRRQQTNRLERGEGEGGRTARLWSSTSMLPPFFLGEKTSTGKLGSGLRSCSRSFRQPSPR